MCCEYAMHLAADMILFPVFLWCTAVAKFDHLFCAVCVRQLHCGLHADCAGLLTQPLVEVTWATTLEYSCTPKLHPARTVSSASVGAAMRMQ